MRTLSRDHERFETTYFKVYPGYYFTGDGCRRDADGYYWLIGDRQLNMTYMTDEPAFIRLLLVSNLHASQSLVITKSSNTAIYKEHGYLQLRGAFIRLLSLQLSF